MWICGNPCPYVVKWERDVLNTIYPVILSVPQNKRHLIGRKKVKYLSAYARDAIQVSAKKSNIVFSVITKDENGVPQPFNGSYWSLTHKSEYVGGVVAPAKIGIDIEKIKRCSKALFKRIADEKEWNLTRSRQIDSKKLFFRYWTSKEAVLKALGTGFKDLSRCKIAQVVDDDNLVVNYKGNEWLVEHFFFRNYIASVVKNKFNIKWTLL